MKKVKRLLQHVLKHKKSGVGYKIVDGKVLKRPEGEQDILIHTKEDDQSLDQTDLDD